jgi:hypothetical protein
MILRIVDVSPAGLEDATEYVVASFSEAFQALMDDMYATASEDFSDEVAIQWNNVLGSEEGTSFTLPNGTGGHTVRVEYIA